jgi:choline dehydrogenase-like flavoprotein
MRPAPADFETRRRFGFGDDWPIGYRELEPYLCRAEAHLGVSGTDDDNPWAPPRSRPFPLPPFELTADDAVLGERLARAELHIHTTPQARTRLDYDGRAGCMNIGECQVCPIGSRYSPNHHLRLAIATGRCRLLTDVSVRRIVTDAAGRARALLYRPSRGGRDREHPADVVLVAAAGIETPRLLLLSRDPRHPDGLGNTGGHVGRHLVFHHVWTGHIHYRDRFSPGTVGFRTAQSVQFGDPPTRGKHGGVKIELSAQAWDGHWQLAGQATRIADSLRYFEEMRHCRLVLMHAESVPTAGKYVSLSKVSDRFGDPVAHLHYDSDDFDRRTYAYSRELFDRVAKGSNGTEWMCADLDDFGTFGHYMGTCRMGKGAGDSVVDSLGAVHDTPGLFVLGLATFAGAAGATNPTLAGVALTLRTADALAERLG